MPFSERTKGRIAAGGISIGGASPRSSGLFVLRLPLPVTAVASTDFVASVPLGSVVVSANVVTSVAYTGTTVTIAIGSTAGGVDYVAATTIKAAQNFPLTLVAAAVIANLLNMPAPPNLFVRVAQTGATATGTGTLFLNFLA